jgi:hypothetical protein
MGIPLRLLFSVASVLSLLFAAGAPSFVHGDPGTAVLVVSYAEDFLQSYDMSLTLFNDGVLDGFDDATGQISGVAIKGGGLVVVNAQPPQLSLYGKCDTNDNDERTYKNVWANATNAGPFRQPVAVTVGTDLAFNEESVWAIDAATGALLQFAEASGLFRKQLVSFGPHAQVNDLEFDASTGVLFVSHATNVSVWSSKTGQREVQLDITAVAHPSGIHFDADARLLWIADAVAGTVVAFDVDVRQVKHTLTNLVAPTSVFVYQSAFVYVLVNSAAIAQYDLSGAEQGRIDLTDQGTPQAFFYSPC